MRETARYRRLFERLQNARWQMEYAGRVSDARDVVVRWLGWADRIGLL